MQEGSGRRLAKARAKGVEKLSVVESFDEKKGQKRKHKEGSQAVGRDSRETIKRGSGGGREVSEYTIAFVSW